MVYYLILEQKNYDAVDDVIEFKNQRELKRYFSEAYFPETWDYRLIEGIEKELEITVKVTTKVTTEIK